MLSTIDINFPNSFNIKESFKPENIFINYFWFLSICAISVYFIHVNTIFNVGFPMLLYVMLAQKCKIKSINLIDFLWIANFLWILSTWFSNSYPNQMYLIIKAVSNELCYMMTYWLTRTNKKNYVQLIISKSRIPLIIGCVVGLYCFFFEPKWYLSSIEHTIFSNYGIVIDKASVLEQYRLRSFYNGPYVLAYFCAIALIYEFYSIFSKIEGHIITLKKVLYIILLIITCILCMMRAPMVCTIIGIVTLSLLFKKDKFIKSLILATIIVFVAISFITYYLDSNILNFFTSKFDSLSEEKENFILRRLFLQAQSFTITGDGYGRYSTSAFYNFGMPTIPDGEYMKIISEQGWIGFIITILMFGFGFIKAVFNRKQLIFELCLLIMLFICMIGADPLSIYDKHCLIFWMTLGQISRYNKTTNDTKNTRNVFATISSNSGK